MRRTKIVCTIGPASSSEEHLRALLDAGMDVARLNFSHGTHQEHREVYDTLRRLSSQTGRPLAILQDLSGPKLRVGEMPDPPPELVAGQPFVLTTREVAGGPALAHLSYPQLAQDVHPGDRILLDDGLLELKVEEVRDPEVHCRVVCGGPLSSHKGVNLPGVSLSIPSVTEKDFDDLLFGLELGVDYVALSFVRKAADVLEVKKFMEDRGQRIPVIAKIEKGEAVAALEEILAVCEGMMVARGDLGVEVPMAQVPLIQKRIIHLCNREAKPVITATQMLDSMIRNPRPTRAEAADVANAILDGTDAVMLSGETASGKYPLESVQAMAQIALEAETALRFRGTHARCHGHDTVAAISLATCTMAEELEARCIVLFTSSGRTARRISSYRPHAPILALTGEDKTRNRMSLVWGVTGAVAPDQPDADRAILEAADLAVKLGLAKDGDLLLVNAGIPMGYSGSTNMVKLHVVGHTYLRGQGVGKPAQVKGRIRRVEGSAGAPADLGAGDILVLSRLTADRVPLLARVAGLVIEEGSADLIPALGLAQLPVPAVVGVPGALVQLKEGEEVLLDISRGWVCKPD